jgi:FkbH-like protein
MNRREYQCLLIADFTVGGLAGHLQAVDRSSHVRCTVAPFDQVRRVLLDGELDCWRPRPDVAVIWTRPEAAIESYGRLLQSEDVDPARILANVEEFAALVRDAANRVGLLLVAGWVWPAYDRGLGLMNLDTRYGPAYHLLKMNARLAEVLSGVSNIFVLDAARWQASAGSRGESLKLWYLGKVAFGPEVFRQAAVDIHAALGATAGRARKLVVLDLDDTLWGGVVGDVGWEQLVLGGHDPMGEAFSAFQRTLKALSRRGIILGIVSKNTEAIALEAISRHPEMVLRLPDFAGWRINWEDKAGNIVELTKELSLGLDSVVFIDDNPAERARVREALPAVLTPEWPATVMAYEQTLRGLDCFDLPSINAEDRRRVEMYAIERERRGAAAHTAALGDINQYLASLEMRVIGERLSRANLPRAAQLLNKTNQMNLRTRRLTEADLWAWAADPSHCTYTFRVQDRFGDYGLTGLASVAFTGHVSEIEDFVLSCRVMGRGVEETMLSTLVSAARTRGASALIARLRPTDRNQPCEKFFHDHSGFQRHEDVFTWEIGSSYPRPTHVTTEVAIDA